MVCHLPARLLCVMELHHADGMAHCRWNAGRETVSDRPLSPLAPFPSVHGFTATLSPLPFPSRLHRPLPFIAGLQESSVAQQKLVAELEVTRGQVAALGKQADEAWELYNAERGMIGGGG